ncbi:MAG: DUF4857 domain-containing protein [Candidatus Marinimicrobia bacterium]|nr:DUF4857 domain-containing protein [Candidatus Neomarinimicrobiota bacterium]
MLNKISRYTIILLMVIVSALYLPDFFSMLFDKKENTPRLSYSSVIDEFVYTKYYGMGQIDYMDIKGNNYSEREYYKLLPFMHYANLEKWGELPLTLKGFEMTSKNIRQNSQMVRIQPKDIDPPTVPLNIMFEAEGDYASLQIPDDIFRISNTIEFLDPASNSVLEEKSHKFQEAMLAAGFTFPAKLAAANQTNRKPFDEGYFIKDATNKIFHLKMIKDEPVCVNTGIDTKLKVRQIFISENMRKEFYGWILTEDNDLYLITYDDYKLRQIPTGGNNAKYDYVANEMTIRFYIYPVDKHINISGDGFSQLIILNNDFKKIAEHVETWTPYDKRPAPIVKSFLFPFELSTYDPMQYVKLQMDIFWWHGLIGIAVSLLALLLFSRKRPWFDYVVVLFTGVFGLIGVLLIKPED